jgi:hypothetical protein
MGLLPLDHFFVAVDTGVLVIQNLNSVEAAVTIDAEVGWRF